MAKGYDLTVQINLRGPANLNNVVNNINKRLNNIQANVNVKVPPNVARQLNALNRNMKGIQKSANTASSTMEKFGKSAGLAIRRFGAFTAATAGFYAITRATTQALEKFVEFDRQITRIAQVTGSTRQALSGLGDEITNLSTSLGVSSQELAQVSVVLSQAGLSAQNTERALKALALTTLAPTFNDLNQTVEGSIALMKQFSITTNQLEGALGSINAVAGQFAVEANDIITAIQRTGGVFAAASNGVSQGTDALNEFIAVFTSVRATTRESAETIATGLRTIFTRIQREDTLEALKAFGIELTDLEGKFVGPFRAIERLSEGLRSLDPRDVKFSSLVEELGGFRQVGKVIPLIQQFATAQNALNVAQQGSGSLARDAALGQQSLGVQIAKVGEEFNALIRSIGQTGEFRQFIGLSLDLASALIKIADAIKPVIPALTALGTIAVGKNIGTFAKGFRGGIGFNKGGMVRGQKGIDKIPTYVTDGEYVIQQPAVKSIGANVLEHINKTGKLPGFRDGGPVKAEDLASSLVRRRVTRTGEPSEYESGKRINATDKIKFQVIEEAISSNKNIGNKAFETKTAKQLGGKKSKSGIAPVDVIVGSGKNAMPVEVRNRKDFTTDAELADKLIRQRYSELGDAAFTNRSDPDTISLGAITVAYNAGKLSAAKQKALTERGGTVQQRKKPTRNKGGYGDPNEFEALVTDGEFIIQESAARKLGPKTLKELNNAHKTGLPKFHTGGMVRRFNKGGGGTSTGGGGGGVLGLVALQGLATTVGSAIEQSGTKAGASIASALQGATSGAFSGVVASQLAGVIGPLKSMAGGIGLAVGAFSAVTGAINGAINAARAFEIKLNDDKIKSAADNISSALERISKDAKDFGAIRDIESGIQKATAGILDNRRIERENPKAFLGNFLETVTGVFGRSSDENMVAAERALILEMQGYTAYLRSADRGTREELMEPIRAQQAQEEARDFKPIADAAIRLFEEQLRGGANISEIIRSDEFDKFNDALARSNPIIAQRIAAIRADTSITQDARQAKINDIVSQEAATQARIRTSALVSQLEIDAAQKTGKTLERVLNRIFANINQTLNAVAKSIDTIFDNIDIEISAATGQPKIGFDDQKLISVLENQQAFTAGEVSAAIDRFAPLLGNQGDIIADAAKASSTLEGDVLAAINRAVQDPDNTTDEAVASAVRKEIEGIVANLNLPPDVANILSRQIEAGIEKLRAKGKDKIGLDTSDVRESIQGFAETIDSFKGANDVIINTAKTYNGALQRYTTVQNKLVDIRVQKEQLLRNSIDVLRVGAENLAKAFGKTASLSQVAAQGREQTARQTGGPFSPREILSNIERLQENRRVLQSGRDTAAQDPNRFEQLQFFDDKLIETNSALKNNIDALQRMASDTTLASAALSKIAQVQQQRQAQGGFLEKLVSSTPEEIASLNSAFATVQRTINGQDTTIQNSVNAQRAYIQTLNETGNILAAQQAAQGALAEDRASAISLGKEIASFLPQNEGNELRADLLQSFLRQTGNLTPQFQQVVNAIRNPEQDPQAAEAIKYYGRSIQQQSNASAALAQIQANLEKQIQASSAQAIASSIASIPLQVNVLNFKDIARGIQPTQNQGQRGRGQQNRAQGGIIYASEGQSIDFQPRGTDTVPAMLTPGEFVVNRKAASRNMGILQNINSGKTSYYQEGGVVGPYASNKLKSQDRLVNEPLININEWNKLVSPGNRKYYTSTRIAHPPGSIAPLDISRNFAGPPQMLRAKIRNAFFQGPSGITVAGFSENLEVDQTIADSTRKLEEGLDKLIEDGEIFARGETLADKINAFKRARSNSASGQSTGIIPNTSGPYISPDQLADINRDVQRGRDLTNNILAKASGLPPNIINSIIDGTLDSLNIYHNKTGHSFIQEVGNLAAYNFNPDTDSTSGFTAANTKRISTKALKEYIAGFKATTDWIRTSPANSDLRDIQKLTSPTRAINSNKLSFNNPAGGRFGLFSSNETDAFPGLGVRKDQDKFVIGKQVSGFSTDGGGVFSNQQDLMDQINLEESQNIYNEVLRHRQILQNPRSGALSQEGIDLVRELDKLVLGRNAFTDLSNFGNFFESPTNPMFGLSRRGKTIFDRNNQSDDFRVSRTPGPRALLGLTDDQNVINVLADAQQEAEDAYAARFKTSGLGAVGPLDYIVRVTNPIPRRDRGDPRQPNTFQLPFKETFDRYQAVFYDDAADEFKARNIQSIRNTITGFKPPVFIPNSRHGLFKDGPASFLMADGNEDPFATNPRHYFAYLERAIRRNLQTVYAMLGIGGGDPNGDILTKFAGKAIGSNKPGFFSSASGNGLIFNIKDAVKQAADQANTGSAPLPDQPDDAVGGQGVLAKFNDMLSDAKTFWGRNTGIATYAKATDLNDATNKAADIANKFMNQPAGNPQLQAWLTGFGQAFANVGGTLIDSYTNAGDVQTVRFAHDLAMRGFGQGLDADGQAFVDKVNNAGWTNFNGQPGTMPGNVQGVFETLMNPQNIFNTPTLRGSGILKMIRSFADNGAYGDNRFKGIPSKDEARGASRILADWYAGYQDKYVGPIRNANDQQVKKELWRKAIRNYPANRYATTNFAHNLLGGSQFGPILNLGQIGTLSQAPLGFSKGGVVYASQGMQVPESFKQGTDTVPAMLTPGEFVVNAKAAKKHKSLLHQINNGGKPSVKNGITYADDGGDIQQYQQMQFNRYVQAFAMQWYRSQGLPMGSPIPLAAIRQARFMAARDVQMIQYQAHMKAMEDAGLLSDRNAISSERESFLDKRRAIRNRQMGLYSDGTRPSAGTRRLRAEKLAKLTQPRPYGEETAQPEAIAAKEETPKPIIKTTSATSGDLSGIKRSDTTKPTPVKPAKEETPKPVVKTTSTTKPKPYTMPERGAGATIVVATVPDKEETPKPVVETEDRGDALIAEMNRKRAETQLALGLISGTENKIKYLQDLWKKEGITLSRERALKLLEIKEKVAETSSRLLSDEPSQTPLTATFPAPPDELFVKPTPSEKRSPVIEDFLNRQQVPLKGSNTIGTRSKTDFNTESVGERILEGVGPSLEMFDKILRTIPLGDTLEDYMMSGGSAINSFLERSGAGYLGLGKELGGGKAFGDQQDYAARSAALKEQISDLLIRRGSAEFYKDLSYIFTLGNFTADPLDSKSINEALESRRNELAGLEISQQERLKKEGISSIGPMAKQAGNIAGDLIPGFAGAPGAESVIAPLGALGMRGIKSVGSIPGHIQDFLKADAARSAREIAANKEATQRYLKYMESKGVSPKEAWDSLRASQITGSNEFIQNSLTRGMSRQEANQQLKQFLEEGRQLDDQVLQAMDISGLPRQEVEDFLGIKSGLNTPKPNPRPAIKPKVRSQGIEPQSAAPPPVPGKPPEYKIEAGRSPRDPEGNLNIDETKDFLGRAPTDDPKIQKIREDGLLAEVNAYNENLEKFNKELPLIPGRTTRQKYEDFLKRTGQKARITDPKQMKIFLDAMERKSKLPEVEEGFTRLYRYGQTADNPRVDTRPDWAKGTGSMNPKTGAPIDPGLGKIKKLEEESAGRFFTDNPNQLDFYVNEGNTPQPFKYVDIPTDKLDKFSVIKGGGQEKFGVLSDNLNAEFVLPDAEIKKALEFNRGGSVLVDYAPQGTDTVPAMLTPGEFVVNREATKKNLGLLKAMNKSRGGKVNNGILYAMNGSDDLVGLSSFTMPSISSGSSGGGIDFSAFSAAVTTFDLAVGSFAAAATSPPVATNSPATTAPTIDFSPLTQFGSQIGALVNKDFNFSVFNEGAGKFASAMSNFGTHNTTFKNIVNDFGSILRQTDTLVQAMVALGNINGSIEVQGSIQMPTEITVNVEGLGAVAGADTANLQSSIMNSIADALQTQMPGINVDGIRNQVGGTGEQQA